MATTYTLEIGIGSGWALREVQIEGRLIERRDGCSLFKLLDGRHVLHIVDGDCHSLLEVEASGRQRISLSEALGLNRR